MIAYWLLRSEAVNTLKNRLLDSTLNSQAITHAASSITSAARKVNIVSRMKRKNELTEKFVRDSLVFAGTSVGTLLKNHGERQLPKYADLSLKEKHVVGMCLNSTIDLSDETRDGQRRFFTDDQWKEMNKLYSLNLKHKKYHDYKKKLKGINKMLENLNIDNGYKKAISLEIENLNGEDESLYNIYAHVINIYRKRREALLNHKKTSTELDSLVKFWSGIFESLFPENKDHIYCKWGESKSFLNEYKIDCRVVIIKNEREVDLMDTEAARYLYQKKTNDDHLKLCVESKDILDYLVNSSTTFNPKKTFIFMIQIRQNCCDIKYLRLCDDGLYCLQAYDSLSIPFSIVDFAKQSPSWFSSLFFLKNNCEKLALHCNDFNSNKGYASHFNRKSRKEPSSNYKSWVRGSFYPPVENELPMKPANLYGDVEQKKQKNQ